VRYFLTLAYNGTSFHGWQRQPNATSVQQTLEEALTTLLRKPIAITGAGRTDTGVHAKEMMAHFEGDLSLEEEENLPYLLNRFLQEEIVIYRLDKVKADAHARFDATARTYEYHLGFQKNPFKQQLYYYFHQPVSLEKMSEAAQILLEYEDFEAFAKTHSDVKTFLCNVTRADWESTAEGAIFTITANRFLRNMVRAIVGTLLEIGTGKIEVADMHKIIQSKNRGEAGFSVPAAGLYLTEIQYPKSIYL
jgi:tRNA pseudouridine38-40 synthase